HRRCVRPTGAALRRDRGRASLLRHRLPPHRGRAAAGEVDRMTAFVLRPENARDRMGAAWKFACQFLELGKAAKVTVEEAKPPRTLDQNAKLNAMCGDVAAQVEWHGQWLSRDDWRHMFV